MNRATNDRPATGTSATSTAAADAFAWLDADHLRLWRQCPRRFWAAQQAQTVPDHDIDIDPDAAVREHDAGQAADDEQAPGGWPDAPLRASFPLGVAIAAPRRPTQWQLAIEHTAHCLDVGVLHDEGGAVFGACLASDDGLLARIDVLAHGRGGARLLRRRHATVGRDEDLDRVTWWAHVAARCGLRIQALGLLLVDTDFVYPGLGLYAGLYREVDLRPVLGARPVAQWVLAMRRLQRPGAMAPAGQAGAHCTHCAQRSACDAAMAASAARAAVPDAATDAATEDPPTQNPRLQRMQRALGLGAPVVEPLAARRLQALGWPRHLLRMDTIGFAVPRWPGTRPYQALPFQWTVARLQADGTVSWQHHLAEPGADPRRAFASQLLQALGPWPSDGPVLAYNAGFERNRLLELAEHLPQQAAALQAVAERLVDLFQLARASAYHPGQNGSWSFRAMARALAPELAAIDGLDAGDVQALFAATLAPRLSQSTERRLRSALQTHGRRQVMVLQRLLAWLQAPTDADGMDGAHRA